VISFEPIIEEKLYIAQEIINSNKDYLLLENGKDSKPIEEIKKELLNPLTISYFIKLDETYIGVIDYMKENQNDKLPWLGLHMIHNDYQGFGFGTSAYLQFEQELIKQKVKKLRLGVINSNEKAKSFWEGLGFTFYKTSEKNLLVINCYEKLLIK
jgi:RimJ/RimL family protein N-acetyltransferase